MNKRVIFLCGILLILFISSIAIFVLKNNHTERPLSEDELPIPLDYVTIEIKPGTLTRRGATFVITNKGNSEICYGEWFRIDIKKEEWVKTKVKDKNYIVSTIPYFIQGGNCSEKSINWSKLYGTLGKGSYRLVTDIYGTKVVDGFTVAEYIAVEFTIE